MLRSGSALPLRHLIFLSSVGLLALLAIGSIAFTMHLTTSLMDQVSRHDVQDAAEDIAFRFETQLADKRREFEIVTAASELRKANENPDAARLYLRRVQETSPRYALIGLVSDEGRVIVTSNRLAEGADVASRPYFIEGKKGLFISDAHEAVLLAEALGGPDNIPRFIDVSAPVRSGEKLDGVVVAHLYTTWAQDLGEYSLQRLTSRYRQMALEVHSPDGTPVFVRSTLSSAATPSLTAEAPIRGIGKDGGEAWTVRVTIPIMAATGLLQTGTPLKFWPMLGLFGILTAGALLAARTIAAPFEGLATAIVASEKPERQNGLSVLEAEDISAAVAMALPHEPSAQGGPEAAT